MTGKQIVNKTANIIRITKSMLGVAYAVSGTEEKCVQGNGRNRRSKGNTWKN